MLITGIKSGDEKITIDFKIGNDECNTYCQLLADALGLGATGVDFFAAGANLTSGLLVYGSGGELYPAWVVASPYFNSIGSVGTVAWAGQGFLTGSNKFSTVVTFNTSSGITLDTMTISGSISQDTTVSGLLDLASWIAPEPISASTASVTGAVYDIVRNPAPSVLPYNGLPTIFDILFNKTIEFSSP